MENSLQLVLVLLLAAVLVVIVFRLLKLPALIGYLLVGVAIGPRGLGLIPDTAGTRGLAEFGVVFLMFSIGLEFSLARLVTMRRIVFGLGASQVALTLAVVVAAALGSRADWRAGVLLVGAGAASGRSGDGVDARVAQGRRGAVDTALLRAASDARLVSSGRQAKIVRAVRAECLVDYARACVRDRVRRIVARARRVRGRHADFRDRVPLSGRRRNQTVSRRAARVVFRHRRHETRHPAGARERVVGRARIARADCAQGVADRRLEPPIRQRYRRRSAHRTGSGAGRRVRLCASVAGRAAQSDAGGGAAD